MKDNQKKALREAYKNRRPDMGVLRITCNPTGDSFLFISKDAVNGFNRHTFQLNAAMHPNKTLQQLWDTHGAAAFTFDTAGLIKYDDPMEDQSDKLDELLETCLADIPGAKKL